MRVLPILCNEHGNAEYGSHARAFVLARIVVSVLRS